MVVLIVESEAIIATSLHWALSDAGHTVLGPVFNARDARSLATARGPQLALIDIDLQQRDEGIDLARYLKLQLSIPTLFLTSRRQAARQHAAIALGVVGKPFNPADVNRSMVVAENILCGRPTQPALIPKALELFPL